MRGSQIARLFGIASTLALAASVAGIEVAQAFELPAGDVINYAAGYRVLDEKPHKVVELGQVRRCGAKVCIRYERFDSAAKLPRVPTAVSHRMQAPYRSANCSDGYVTTVLPGQAGDAESALVEHEGQVSYSSAGLIYEWRQESRTPNGLLLTSLKSTSDAQRFDQVVGFAMLSRDQAPTPVPPEVISARYLGEYFHKNAQETDDASWKHSETMLNAQRFTQIEGGAALVLSTPGLESVNKKYGKQMWVQNTILLTRPGSGLRPIVQEYGHDFNMNGCFDDFGHNKLLLPNVDSTGVIHSLVFVEYSPLDRGGQMLSVGRYYR